jgi:predicted O-methyltransferase YrrM
MPRHASMQIGPEQAAFMRMLTTVMGVRQAVEVGTFTGLSSLSIARGLADGGRIICFDVSEEYTAVARVRQNGVLLVDNTLWSGEVVDRRSASGRVMAEFNDMALADGRVELVILPLLDGLTMARKR